jgi:hypothetical protein
MSQPIPCNLLLGIQTVSLRVNKDEEFCVRNAALLVNRLVKFYEKKANSLDPSAVMALVALDLAMCGLKFESEKTNLLEDVQAENEQLLAMAEEFTL